jgi:hypothetical protein
MSEAEIQGLLQSYIFLSCFNLSSCSRHSLKVVLLQSLVLLNPMCLLKHVLKCEQSLTVTGLKRICYIEMQREPPLVV